MASTIAQLDKSFDAAVSEGYGTISIRVVVLDKKAPAASLAAETEEPLDVTPDELLPELDKRPTSSFLEEPKRGRLVCVFLINGQRQHAWDNQFIVRDLELKYLRTRMLVVVDCDGLKPEAIAELMQGSRQQFYEGAVYAALEARVLAALKGDPDLLRLEEEAEDELASLKAGDEAVKAALDQLIESHHDAGEHTDRGHGAAGATTRDSGVPGTLVLTENVVVEADPTAGSAGSDPVLLLQPDVATIRLRPNEAKRITLQPRPAEAWNDLEAMLVTVDPPQRELQITRNTQLTGDEITLLFAEPEDFEQDEYPIETTLRATAVFKGHDEPRLLERRVVINPKRDVSPAPPVPLKDDPTLIKVTSRQPVRLVVGGPDVHVRLRWDGKDELTTGTPPDWTFRVNCEAPSVEPAHFLTRPVDGRFELLIQAAPGLTVGEQIKFDVEAMGPGKSLTTSFLVEVAAPPSARLMGRKIIAGATRRPPYELVYLERKNWDNDKLSCFGEPWSGEYPGSFEAPSAKSPLNIFINQDMDLLISFRDSLLAKRLAEATIQQRVNRYTAHVAFHLYQMYERTKRTADGDGPPSDAMMREEIGRVSHTLLKLMEVSG